jgi:hypothetical protein
MRLSRLFLPLVMTAALGGPAAALDPGYFPRNAYQERFCAGLDAHYRATNAARIDCTDGTHAIVVEYQDFWPEAVGTAMAFATATGLEPAIVMVCRNDGQHCANAAAGIEATFARFALPLTLWQCRPIDASLEDCDRLR